MIILGDINGQLPPNIDNHTDNWAFGGAPKNTDNVIDILRLNDLFAINTKFEPPKHSSNATYISTTKKGSTDTSETSSFVGRKVQTVDKGKLFEGTVQEERITSSEVLTHIILSRMLQASEKFLQD